MRAPACTAGLACLAEVTRGGRAREGAIPSSWSTHRCSHARTRTVSTHRAHHPRGRSARSDQPSTTECCLPHMHSPNAPVCIHLSAILDITYSFPNVPYSYPLRARSQEYNLFPFLFVHLGIHLSYYLISCSSYPHIIIFTFIYLLPSLTC